MSQTPNNPGTKPAAGTTQAIIAPEDNDNCDHCGTSTYPTFHVEEDSSDRHIRPFEFPDHIEYICTRCPDQVNTHQPEDLPGPWLAASIVSIPSSNVSAGRADQLVTKYFEGETEFFSEFGSACYDNDLEDLLWDARDWWMRKEASDKAGILRRYMNQHRKIEAARQSDNKSATATAVTATLFI